VCERCVTERTLFVCVQLLPKGFCVLVFVFQCFFLNLFPFTFLLLSTTSPCCIFTAALSPVSSSSSKADRDREGAKDYDTMRDMDRIWSTPNKAGFGFDANTTVRIR